MKHLHLIKRNTTLSPKETGSSSIVHLALFAEDVLGSIMTLVPDILQRAMSLGLDKLALTTLCAMFVGN